MESRNVVNDHARHLLKSCKISLSFDRFFLIIKIFHLLEILIIFDKKM
jgi:hypothetical protein